MSEIFDTGRNENLFPFQSTRQETNTSMYLNDLMSSETSLHYIPKMKFDVGSWSVTDPFIDYASNLFSLMLVNLFNGGYLRVVENQTKSFKILGLPLWSNSDYVVKLMKEPADGLQVGWLEQEIFNHFNYYVHTSLKTLIYQVLSKTLGENRNSVNPGKALIIQLLQHQKMHLFDYEKQSHLFSTSMVVRRNDHRCDYRESDLIYLDDMNVEGIAIATLKKIVRQQLNRFTAD